MCLTPTYVNCIILLVTRESLFMSPHGQTDTERLDDEAHRLIQALRGRPDAWTAGVLAGMTSTWLAGWPPPMRQQIFDHWVDLVHDLIVAHERMFFRSCDAGDGDNDNGEEQ